MPRIRERSDGYTILYPKAIEYEDKQQDTNWTAKEIAVEDDINDLRVHSTAAESHGVLHVLKLFTQYELIAGEEFWGGRFKRLFPRVEFQRMAAQFSQVELCVHAPFYNKINEVLFLNTPEFYNEWKDDRVLRERMAYINDYVQSNEYEGLLSLAVFSMVEGAILYSSFAFLKAFKKQGKNLIPNIVSGINFSVRDENLHSEAGAWAFRQYLAESKYKLRDVQEHIERAAHTLYEHETAIVDQIFAEGEISGITPHQLKHFVAHRINVCLSQLGIGPMFSNLDDTIASWFYEDIAGAKATDHFYTLSSNYSRNWNEAKFEW